MPAGDAAPQPGVAPLLAQPGELAVIDITVPEPRIDLDSWRLDVDGEVDAELCLTLPELLALPLEERDLLMVCVHNPVGGSPHGLRAVRSRPATAPKVPPSEGVHRA